MKKWISVISLILNAVLIISLVATVSISQTKIYTFSGKNEHIIIDGGQIVKSKSFEQVKYQSFAYIGEFPENAYEYKVNLYFIDDNEKVNIFHSGAEINPNTGSTLDKNDIMLDNQNICVNAYGNIARQLQGICNRDIIDNFYFEIVFTTYDGQQIIQTLKLDVVFIEN